MQWQEANEQVHCPTPGAHLLEREADHGQGLVDGRREPREQVLARRLELAPRDLQ